MSNERLIWGGGLALIAVLLLGRALIDRPNEPTWGRAYVRPVRVLEWTTAPVTQPTPATVLPLTQLAEPTPAGSVRAITYTDASRLQADAQFSWWRTLGLWVAALLTLCSFSYLYRDNLGYRLAESLVVGVSAAYGIITAVWSYLVPYLLKGLAPVLTAQLFLPREDLYSPTFLKQGWNACDWTMLAPLFLGMLLFSRFAPKWTWLSRWPVAFVVGTYAGIRLTMILESDFVMQIGNSILPLIVVADGRIDYWRSLTNSLTIFGLICCLTYFFFSIEHKGTIGGMARIGVWVLMITFGASFAYTVMGRITLLTLRLEFLLGDWLGLLTE